MNTQKITLKKNTDPYPLITIIFEFFLNTELTVKSSGAEITIEAKRFLELHSGTTQESADEITFSDSNLFQFPVDCEEGDKGSFVVGLIKFHNQVRSLLDTTPVDFDVNIKTEKLYSPPYKSYEYRGMSELNILGLQKN